MHKIALGKLVFQKQFVCNIPRPQGVAGAFGAVEQNCGNSSQNHLAISGKIAYSRDMDKKILDYMEKNHMTEPGDTVIVGLSGGADSVCLILMLKSLEERLSIRVRAVHVNHGLRVDAGEDEDYVKALCTKHRIPLRIVHADVKGYAKAHGIGSEEAGRLIRYRALQEACCPQADFTVSENGEAEEAYEPDGTKEGRFRIAVAHHMDDRAETVLFHLFRGTGLSGLIGIRPVRENVIRPLLCVTRREIEQWLSQKKVNYCMDFTNNEDTYTRNKIRHHILPYAEQEICRRSTEHVADAADICMEAEEYISACTEELYDKCVICKNGSARVDVPAFQKGHSFLQKRVLLFIFEQLIPHRKDMEAVHVESVRELFYGVSGRRISLPYGMTARREYDTIVIEKAEENSSKDKSRTADRSLSGRRPEIVVQRKRLEADGKLEIGLPDGQRVLFTLLLAEENRELFEGFAENIPQKTYTKWFDYDKIKKSMAIRGRRTGDYLRIRSGGDRPAARKLLKDYFITEKVPRQERDRIILLAEEEHVLWVMGHRISEYYKVEKDTRRILQVQLRGEKADG